MITVVIYLKMCYNNITEIKRSDIMSVLIDLTGKRYGSLTVEKIAVDEPGKKKKWLCKCDCGNEIIVTSSNLVSGRTSSCKICGKKRLSEKNKKHGMTSTKLYGVWNSIKTRCTNTNSKSYKDYGARGIRICEEWKESSNFFEWALANGYKNGLEIDRIDVNGNYEPSNCRWVAREQNSNNKRNNKYIEYNGETKTLAEWSRYFDVNYKNLSRNLIKGYSFDEAVKRIKSGERTHMGSKNWKSNRVT